MTAGRLRVGTDLVHIDDVTDSIAQFGDRYLRRVYTDAELDTCRHGSGYAAPRLAARFAAKEAAIKVLRPEFGASYRDIALEHDTDGSPTLTFSGTLLDRAMRIGIQDLSVSVSHDGAYAVAVLAAIVHDIEGEKGTP